MKKFQNYIELLAAFDLVICVSNQSRADLFEFWKRNEVTAGVETFVAHWPLEFDQNERSAAHSARPVILCVSSFNCAQRTTYDFLMRPENYGTAASNSNFNSLVRARTGEGEWRLKPGGSSHSGRPIRWA